MKIPIRLKQYKVNNKTTSFNLWSGIKNIIQNFRVIFAGKVLTGGSAFYVISEDVDILRDVSLILDKEDGTYKFVNTPEGQHTSMLEISENVRES